MENKEYEELVDCLEWRKRDNGDEFVCMKDSTPERIKNMVHEVMQGNDNHNFDLDYQIMNDALNFLSEYELKDIEESRDELDERMYESEYASVYTSTRLEYLNNWTENEISDKVKEYGCDIQTACAVWYDEQVRIIINRLLDEILA